jgi:hypothetical protein
MPFSRSQNSRTAKKSAFITCSTATPSGEQKSRQNKLFRLWRAGDPANFTVLTNKIGVPPYTVKPHFRPISRGKAACRASLLGDKWARRSEIRRPKSEGRRKAEVRNPKAEEGAKLTSHAIFHTLSAWIRKSGTTAADLVFVPYYPIGSSFFDANQWSKLMLPSFLLRWLEPGWIRLTVGEHSGIAFVDTSRAKNACQAFVTRTTEALDLIRRVDSRRFNLIRAQIKYIIHQELPFAYAKYDRQLRACYVDFTRLDFSKHPTTMSWGYAAIVVHEATHGRIHGFGVPNSRRNRERIEYLCDAESARFLRRNGHRTANAWQEIMSRPGRHERLWAKTWWQRMAALWKRRHGSGGGTNRSLQATRRGVSSSASRLANRREP